MKITFKEFESLIRRENPEVYTEDQMNSWIESQKETLIKAEVDELNEVEKAEVDLFNEEFKSFTRVTVVYPPHKDDLNKGLNYQTLYMRDQQVEWQEEDIVKSIDGKDEIEKSRYGTYTNTELNRKLNRVGQKFGEVSNK